MSAATEAETQTQVAPEPRKSSRGCLYGCLGFILICILTVACLITAGYYFVTGQVEKYTSDTPSELPKVEYTPEQMAELKNRFETFETAVKEGEPAQDLVLNAEEINALINDREELRGRAFVTIENDQVTGDVSFPTDVFPGGKGRFFNAKGTFDVSLDNGVLIVRLMDAEVKGEAVPESVMEALRQENLAKDAYKDPDNAKVLRRFESVEVKDDTIVFRLRKDVGEADDAGGESDAEGDDASETAEPAEEETEASETAGDETTEPAPTP